MACTGDLENRVFNIINLLFSTYGTSVQATNGPQYQDMSITAKNSIKKSKKLIKNHIFQHIRLLVLNFTTRFHMNRMVIR
jgi:hypothetical protein